MPLTSHNKYQLLADRLLKNHWERRHPRSFQHPEPASREPTPLLHREKIAFNSPCASSLEIFHQFDLEQQHIEWSYYTEKGEFLLQYAFHLKNKIYEIHSLNAALWQSAHPLSAYFSAIQSHLKERYPSLGLKKHSDGQVTLEKV